MILYCPKLFGASQCYMLRLVLLNNLGDAVFHFSSSMGDAMLLLIDDYYYCYYYYFLTSTSSVIVELTNANAVGSLRYI